MSHNVKWIPIDKIPEDFLDGRKVLVYDTSLNAPRIAEYVGNGYWNTFRGSASPPLISISHFACDLEACPDDLSPFETEMHNVKTIAECKQWAHAFRCLKVQDEGAEWPQFSSVLLRAFTLIAKFRNTRSMLVCPSSIVEGYRDATGDSVTTAVVSASFGALCRGKKLANEGQSWWNGVTGPYSLPRDS